MVSARLLNQGCRNVNLNDGRLVDCDGGAIRRHVTTNVEFLDDIFLQHGHFVRFTMHQHDMFRFACANELCDAFGVCMGAEGDVLDLQIDFNHRSPIPQIDLVLTFARALNKYPFFTGEHTRAHSSGTTIPDRQKHDIKHTPAE
jgi:hypothetical protein